MTENINESYNILYIVKGVCNNKENIIKAVKALLNEKVNFRVCFVDENYVEILTPILVKANRNTIEDVDIIAGVIDKFNRM